MSVTNMVPNDYIYVDQFSSTHTDSLLDTADHSSDDSIHSHYNTDTTIDLGSSIHFKGACIHKQKLPWNTHVHSSTDITRISSSDVIDRGLSLVGYGLKKGSRIDELSTLKSKNLSTGDINSTETSIDISSPPAEEIIEDIFDNLLKSGTFFRHDAIKNLKTISKKRKWALICKIRSNNSLVSANSCASESSNPTFSKQNEFLYNLSTLLSNDLKLSRTLYQLEKLLRQSPFCESFVSLNLTETLANHASKIPEENQFVYLRCFRSIMNLEKGRLAILNCGHFVEHLCLLISDQVSHLKMKIQSSELLLLLTYVDDQFGSEKVLIYLADRLELLLRYLSELLSAHSPTRSESYPTPFFLQYSKTEELTVDFVSTSLFLINSIVQVLANEEKKMSFIKNLKECGIHRCFTLMKSLQSPVISEQIEIYSALERKLTEDFTHNVEWSDISYGDTLSILIKETKNTTTEEYLAQIFKLLLDILLSKTSSESIKVFKAFDLILNYLVNNLDHGMPIEPDSLFHSSLNNFVDNIQSEEISNRGLKEIGELEGTIEKLKEQIKELHDLKDLGKEDIVAKLRQSTEQLQVKNADIEKLHERLEKLEEMRRMDKKRFDQMIAHQELVESKNKTSTVFNTLKNNKLPQTIKLSCGSSLSKSQRVVSLASYVTERHNKSLGIDGHPNCKRTSTIIGAREVLNLSSNQNNSAELSHLDARIPLANDSSSAAQNSPLPLSTPTLTDFLPDDSHPGALLPAPPPPPPPPMPENLASFKPVNSLISSFGDNSAAPSPPPPPPPPPLPIALVPAKDTSGQDRADVSHANEVPGGAAAPPPPPPPPPFSSVPFQNPLKIPTVTLKQIHWDKIGNIEETLWADKSKRDITLSELKNDGILLEIEKNFRIKERMPSKPKKKDINETSKKTFLSRDLAHQFGINLHMFSSYSAQEFILKVLTCDNEVIQNITALEFFNRDDLVHIPPNLAKHFAPYGTDYLNGGEPSKDPNELDRPDRVFLELCYNLKSYWCERSFCLLVLTTYERDYYDLVYRLQKIDDVIQRLNNATKLKDLLFIIIEIGNHMNKKNVDGIKISSLSKLTFIKSSDDNGISFIHFIERIIRYKYPEIYGFTDDLNKVESLGKISLEHVEHECEELCVKIEKVLKIFGDGKLSDPKRLHQEDRIIDRTRSRLKRAKVKGSLLKDQLLLTTRDLKKLMKYFGENYHDRDSKNTFFDNFIEFSAIFKKCAKENIEKEEIQRIYEQRKSLLESKPDSSRELPSSDNLSAPEGADVGLLPESAAVDRLLAKLRGVEKGPEPLRRRISVKRLENSSSEPVSATITPPADDTDDRLLKRTQALLSGIQNI